MAKPTILLVDDETDVLSALGFRLKMAGYDLVTARDGADALAQMQRRKIDVVLSDFMMPEMNGIELTRVIKSHPLWFDTQVIVVSCNTDPEFRRKALDLGASDYLPKTAGAKAIVERVFDLVRPEPDVEPATPAAPPPADPRFSLMRSLIAMLEVVGRAGELPEASKIALDSAKRTAHDLERMLPNQAEAPEEGTPALGAQEADVVS